MPAPVFRDRRVAGRALAAVLAAYARRADVRVLGLLPGGIAVAAEVAEALHAPLDVFLVRRLAVPGREHYTMGAVASGGVRVRNDNVVRLLGLREADVEAAVEAARRDIEHREQLLRDHRPALDVQRASVLLVDDGQADVATLLGAVKALRALQAARVVVALPSVPADVAAQLRHDADDVIAARPPELAGAPGVRYEDDATPDDDAVRDWLAHAAHAAA